MTFQDLPHDLSLHPLTDPRLVADVLDLCVPLRDRQAGALCVLICDERDCLAQPVVIGEIGRPRADERLELLGNVVQMARGVMPGGALLLAIARADGLSLTADDELWATTAAVAADDYRLLGVHVVTMHGSREIPYPSAA
jgi:hypothetical protein